MNGFKLIFIGGLSFNVSLDYMIIEVVICKKKLSFKYLFYRIIIVEV